MLPHLRAFLGSLLSALLAFLFLLVGTFVLCVLFLTRCATGPDQEPTPEHPRVACISVTARMNPLTGGKVLPEIVRLIGVTSPEDGERWMVVRGVYDKRACLDDINSADCGWLPFDRDRIQLGAVCGAQAQAFREIDQKGIQ